MDKERIGPWHPLLLYLSVVLAVAGGIALGVNQGALDLQWTEAVYNWLQAPHNERLLAWLDWVSMPSGGQLPSILLIGGSISFWGVCLWKQQRRSLPAALHRRRKNAEIIVLASLLVALITPLSKGIVARERPRYHKDNVHYTTWYDCVSRHRSNPIKRGSFPSGHTLQATLVFGVVFWVGKNASFGLKGLFLKSGLGLLTFLYVMLIGFSRIALAKHWISDVFFACIVGFWVVSFSAWVVLYKAKLETPLFAFAWRRRQGMAARIDGTTSSDS